MGDITLPLVSKAWILDRAEKYGLRVKFLRYPPVSIFRGDVRIIVYKSAEENKIVGPSVEFERVPGEGLYALDELAFLASYRRGNFYFINEDTVMDYYRFMDSIASAIEPIKRFLDEYLSLRR